MTHAHLTAWFLALVLFFIAFGLHKGGKQKGAKIVQMILRLFYLLILLTGVMLLFSIANISFLYILKAIVGLRVIAAFEMILGKTAKRDNARGSWIQLIIAFVLVLYLGFSMP